MASKKYLDLNLTKYFGAQMLANIKLHFADKGAFETVSGKVDTLIGSTSGDDAKSVRTIASEEVAKIVASADASYDTLKEIADWFLSDTTGAAKMANDISALQTKTELGTHTVYVSAGEGAKYDQSKTYYTDNTGATEVDTTSFEDGVTDVSSYYVASTAQYSTVKNYVENYVASQISAAELSEGDGIDISNVGVVSVEIDSSNARGLSVGANGLALAAATPSTSGEGGSAGAMTASDKEKLDNADVTEVSR